MNLFFRFLRIFLPAWFARERTQPLDVHVIKSAVWIGDHDPMGHMTNSRPVGWEGSYILFEHKFISKGRTVAESRMVARLVGRRKQRVTIDMVFEGYGLHMDSPEISPQFRAMLNDLEARP